MFSQSNKKKVLRFDETLLPVDNIIIWNKNQMEMLLFEISSSHISTKYTILFPWISNVIPEERCIIYWILYPSRK